MRNPSQSGTSPAIVCTCYPKQVNAPRLNPSPQAGTLFTYPEEMEG